MMNYYTRYGPTFNSTTLWDIRSNDELLVDMETHVINLMIMIMMYKHIQFNVTIWLNVLCCYILV